MTRRKMERNFILVAGRKWFAEMAVLMSEIMSEIKLLLMFDCFDCCRLLLWLGEKSAEGLLYMRFSVRETQILLPTFTTLVETFSLRSKWGSLVCVVNEPCSTKQDTASVPSLRFGTFHATMLHAQVRPNLVDQFSELNLTTSTTCYWIIGYWGQHRIWGPAPAIRSAPAMRSATAMRSGAVFGATPLGGSTGDGINTDYEITTGLGPAAVWGSIISHLITDQPM